VFVRRHVTASSRKHVRADVPGGTQIQRGWRLCFRSAQLGQRGELSDTIASLAKMNNTRKARHIIAEARDLLRGNGILLENHVMRHLADIEAVHTYEGTETIQTLLVGRAITGHAAFV
jgi:glutaryl-CoA dehydrogenase